MADRDSCSAPVLAVNINITLLSNQNLLCNQFWDFNRLICNLCVKIKKKEVYQEIFIIVKSIIKKLFIFIHFYM
jgi:hypothetical protein